MPPITVTTLDQTSFTLEQVLDLVHDAFRERVEQGLHFGCATMDLETFKEKTSRSRIFVAMDQEGALVGTVSITWNPDARIPHADHDYLAVSPAAKRSGVASALKTAWEPWLRSLGCQYVLSDTAVCARSSVRWHLKQGFKIFGLRSFSSTNYYSYLFRLQYAPVRRWQGRVYPALRFVQSAIKEVIVRDRNGRNRFNRKH